MHRSSQPYTLSLAFALMALAGADAQDNPFGIRPGFEDIAPLVAITAPDDNSLVRAFEDSGLDVDIAAAAFKANQGGRLPPQQKQVTHTFTLLRIAVVDDTTPQPFLTVHGPFRRPLSSCCSRSSGLRRTSTATRSSKVWSWSTTRRPRWPPIAPGPSPTPR